LRRFGSNIKNDWWSCLYDAMQYFRCAFPSITTSPLRNSSIKNDLLALFLLQIRQQDVPVASRNCQVLLNETYWTKDELEKRAKITSEWRRLCNSGCHQDVLLTYLQEEKSQEIIFEF